MERLDDAVTESPVSHSGSTPGDLAASLLSEQTVSALLDKIVEVAVVTIDDVAAASISIATKDSPGYQTVSASHDSARSLDHLQYSTDDGPCVEAIKAAQEVTLSLPAERWASFSAAATAAGFMAVWSLPLVIENWPGGSLNLYHSAAGTWDGEDARAARLVADQSVAVLASARELARSEHINLTLRQALETRTVIGQAQGVLMARQAIGPEEAFDILRKASQRTNRKLRDIAAEIVSSVRTGTDPD